jgi:hypothetical protein
MSDYYQKYLKYKKKYLHAKNVYLNQTGSAAADSPPRTRSIRSEPPKNKGKKRSLEEPTIGPWTSLYNIGEIVYFNNGIRCTVMGKNISNFKHFLILETVNPSESYPGPFSISDPKLIKPLNARKIYFYGGCLCPPHVGHLNIIEALAQELIESGEQNKLYVGLQGDDFRHHFKTIDAKEIINNFLILKGITNVIILDVGSEEYDFPQLDIIKTALNREKLNHRDILKVLVGEDYIREDRIERFNQKLNEVDNEFDIYIKSKIIQRPEESNYSSTNLISLVKQLKNKEITDTVFNEHLRSFMPKVFSDSGFINIVKQKLIESQQVNTVLF